MTPIAQGLHEANSRLNHWLSVLAPAHAEPVLATPEHMAGLLADLMRAGEWLRSGISRENDPELDHELTEYRTHIERLRQLLPAIQGQLLTERARIEAERAHLEAASAWARTCRRTT